MIKRKTGLRRYTPANKVSKTQQKRLNQYRPVKKDFLSDNPECAVQMEGCHFVATQIHHGKGKTGDMLFEKKWMIPVCDGSCHLFLETNPDYAKQIGLSFNRHE